MSRCPLCGLPETQQHVNVACLHPPLTEIRSTHRRSIEEFFQMYRHQHLPSGQRWIVPVMDYAEDHLWANTTLGGDIWNGRWLTSTFEDLLPTPLDLHIPTTDVKKALTWLRRLTSLLQCAQQGLFRARHIELMSKEAKVRRDRIATMRKCRHSRKNRTLYEAWRLPYHKPLNPRRRYALPPTVVAQPPSASHKLWTQYSRAFSSANTTIGSQPLEATPSTIPKSKRNPKHTNRLKLCKLRNILLLCR
jgi:hypothetical protein